MTRIRSLKPGLQSVRPHPTSTDCYYQLVQESETSVLLHLSTFGSEERAISGKSSQSIQIDECVARQLVDILTQTFNFRSQSSK